MRNTQLDYVVRGPDQYDSAIIWLHGLGADGNDFVPIVPEMGLTDTRFIFPHAPQRAITLNGGMRMRGWYDIISLESGAPQDEAGIRESQRMIDILIDDLIASGTPSERILLAGFSQGGVLALQTGLRRTERLAGIMALSTYLALADSVESEASPGNRDIPIFMAHGRHDDVIALPYAEASRDRLTALGYQVHWGEYSMPHSLCPEEIADIRAWLGAQLQANAARPAISSEAP